MADQDPPEHAVNEARSSFRRTITLVALEITGGVLLVLGVYYTDGPWRAVSVTGLALIAFGQSLERRVGSAPTKKPRPPGFL